MPADHENRKYINTPPQGLMTSIILILILIVSINGINSINILARTTVVLLIPYITIIQVAMLQMTRAN